MSKPENISIYNPEDYQYSQYLFFSNQIYRNTSEKRLLIFSTRSGAILYLDTHDFELVKKKIIPPKDTLLFITLVKAEILVPKTSRELNDILRQNHEATKKSDDLIFTIMPTSYCNMGCNYCGQIHKREHLNESLLNNITERIRYKVELNKPNKIEVNWFGGEPMIGFSQMIKIGQKLIPLADKLNINYLSSITTNGSLLTIDKIRQLLIQARVNNYQITLDGPAHIHNKRRCLKKGNPNSFDYIIKIIQQVISLPEFEEIKITLRTNIDKDNWVFVDEYLEMMHAFGFNHRSINFDLTFVYPWSNDVSAIELPKQEFAEQEVLWMIKMIELGLKFTLVPKRKKVVCVAVTPHDEVYGANGKIFSCTEHPLVPHHEANDAIGNLANLALVPSTGSQFDKFNTRDIHQLPCSSCLFIGICGGACPKHWQEGHPPCPSFKYNIQERLDLAAIKKGYYIMDN